MKKAFSTTLGFFVLIFIYIVYVGDRIILAPFPKNCLRFSSWADLTIPSEERDYLDIFNSTARVFVVSMVIVIIWLFK